jgi:large subunit ribosomal protein L1
MGKISKKRKQHCLSYDRDKPYSSLKEASEVVKKITSTKFDASVDLRCEAWCRS